MAVTTNKALSQKKVTTNKEVLTHRETSSRASSQDLSLSLSLVNCRKPPHSHLGLQKRPIHEFLPETTAARLPWALLAGLGRRMDLAGIEVKHYAGQGELRLPACRDACCEGEQVTGDEQVCASAIAEASRGREGGTRCRRSGSPTADRRRAVGGLTIGGAQDATAAGLAVLATGRRSARKDEPSR